MHGMRPLGELLPKEEALARLLAAATPVARAERVPLAQARGRVAAETARAPFPVPSFDRSTMDGYAVRSGDGARLRVVGEVLAGQAPRAIARGEALRIATGAPLPPGADAVVRVEDTDEAEGIVTLRVAARARQFVDPAGSDLAQGATVVAEGELLTPARLGLLASVGARDAAVWARPRVVLASSGDELLRPGDAARAFAIYDANTTSLAALLEANGAEVAPLPHLPDEQAAIERALATDAALVLLSGGASAGAKDLVIDAVRALGGDVLFHGVRVKPGKPLLAARLGGKLVVGLPGNPTSALSNASLFVAPLVRRLARLPDAEPRVVEATLAADVKGEPERYLFLPVRLDAGRALPVFKGSGALTSMAASDGWLGVPEGASFAAGARVRVTLW